MILIAALLMQPAANHSDDASRRRAEMKTNAMIGPVCGTQAVLQGNLSQENRGFDPQGNTKHNRGLGDANEIRGG